MDVMKLHLCVYRVVVLQFESTERLGKFSVLRNGIHN